LTVILAKTILHYQFPTPHFCAGESPLPSRQRMENGELIIENVVGSQLAVCQPCRF
jgi:hypothetical protein